MSQSLNGESHNRRAGGVFWAKALRLRGLALNSVDRSSAFAPVELWRDMSDGARRFGCGGGAQLECSNACCRVTNSHEDS